jgi:hypothetical protein
MQSDFGRSCKAVRAAITVSPVPLAHIRLAASTKQRAAKPSARNIFGVSAGALSIALLAATAIVRVTGAHLYLQPAGTIAVQFGQKLDVQVLMNPTVSELRSVARAADFPVQLPVGLPANTPLRRLLLVEHNTIMLQYDLPGAWRRNEKQLWIVLTNPKAVTAPSDEQSVGHFLQLGAFGPRGKVQERWQVGGETVIIVQSKALPDELAAIKHAMLARLAQKNRSPANRDDAMHVRAQMGSCLDFRLAVQIAQSAIV